MRRLRRLLLLLLRWTQIRLHPTMYIGSKINAAHEEADDRVDQIANKRCHDSSERRTDDDTDSHVHDVAFGDEVFKFF